MGLLESADVDAIADAYGPDGYKHAGVLASITVSIDELPAADQDRYRELAVFAGRGSVPPAAVSALWVPAGYSAARHRAAARPAHRPVPGPARRPGMDHTPRPPVRRRRPPAQTQSASHKPTAASSTATAPGSRERRVSPAPIRPATLAWAGGPDDGYSVPEPRLPPRSGRVLRAARRAARRLRVAGTQARGRRHQRPARRLLTSTTPPARRRRGPRRTATVRPCSRPRPRPARQPADVGRLLRQPEPSIRALLDAARRSDGHPWLCPRTPGSLTEPGGPLERILQGHARFSPTWIRAVAVTPDGQRIVSGGQSDGTVRVWNLASGRLERTLEGHTGGVEGGGGHRQTASASSPAATTAPCGSGTWPAGASNAPWKATPARSRRWRSPPTASASSPAATTAPCGSGTWPADASNAP